MATYASLVSLVTVIDQIQHHPSPPITLDRQQVESLCNTITFLLGFLEAYPQGAINDATDVLESRILEAAYAAEDMIESHLVDQILGESTCCAEKTKTNLKDQLYRSLEQVVQDFDLLEKEVREIKERTLIKDRQLPAQSIPSGSVRHPSKGQQKSHMVGFDDVLHQVLDKLTGHQSSRQVMPIVGMGGIGKTTLARNAFEDQLTVQHFDIRSWVTISEEYNVREILLGVLSCKRNNESRDDWSQKSDEELEVELHKSLSGRRYLVIMDDMWSIEVWNKVNRFFPDNNNGSRIMVTTRMLNLASQLTDSHIVKLNFLDEEQSWKLLCKIVFGEELCPDELKEVGRKIAKTCKGLPLSIAVIGGLLAKSTRTLEYWKSIAKNLKSFLNLEEDKSCSKILYTSYQHLPIHLKPCFLYMGVFSEDKVIKASNIIKLWAAEGFIKPVSGKSSEVTAKAYLEDLVDRNLILVNSFKFDGEIKDCHLHDLLRDVCLEEAEKDKYFCVSTMHNLSAHPQRRIICHGVKLEEESVGRVLNAFQSSSLARSLIGEFDGTLPQLPFKLMRVFIVGGDFDFNRDMGWCFPEVISNLVNSRFLSLDWTASWLPSSLHLFWNLQTLFMNAPAVDAPSEIWKIHQLRHIKIGGLQLPDPSSGTEFGLWNLQSLSSVHNLKYSEEVVKRIPNIKKLKSNHGMFSRDVCSDYFINNLSCLQKLESLTLNICERTEHIGLVQKLSFPHSLKKVCLEGAALRWKDVTAKLGSLPLLQVLKLRHSSAKGSKWNLAEGKFCSLRILEIYFCSELKYWVAETIHFPRLEHINLRGMTKLKEIPSDIGEIPTLQSIKVAMCRKSVVASAKKIQEEQEELGNFSLKVEIIK